MRLAYSHFLLIPPAVQLPPPPPPLTITIAPAAIVVLLLLLQWMGLTQRAQVAFVCKALRAKGFTLWEAFTALDYDNNGMLSPSEIYGGLRWLQVGGLLASSVIYL